MRRLRIMTSFMHTTWRRVRVHSQAQGSPLDSVLVFHSRDWTEMARDGVAGVDGERLRPPTSLSADSGM